MGIAGGGTLMPHADWVDWWWSHLTLTTSPWRWYYNPTCKTAKFRNLERVSKVKLGTVSSERSRGVPYAWGNTWHISPEIYLEYIQVYISKIYLEIPGINPLRYTSWTNVGNERGTAVKRQSQNLNHRLIRLEALSTTHNQVYIKS